MRLLFAGRLSLFQRQPERTDHAGQRLYIGLQNQDVALTQIATGQWRVDTHVVADHAENLGIRLGQFGIGLTQMHAGQLAVFHHPHLGEVGTGIKTLGARLLACRHQPPARQRNEQHTQERHRQPHRGEIEHLKAAADTFLTKTRDNQIGRRADQGGHATQNGAEGQGHQHLPRSQIQPSRQLHRHRHQQRHRADVIHEPGQEGPQPGQGRDTEHRPRLFRQHMPGQYIHGAGHLQPTAKHQHTGHGHYCRMSKAQKRLIGLNQTGEHTGQQRTTRHHIVAPTPPNKHHQGGKQNKHDQQLVLGHQRLPLSVTDLSACGSCACNRIQVNMAAAAFHCHWP